MATRIRRLRETLHLSPAFVAAQLGISDAAYDDLERYDDEISTALSIQGVVDLAAVFRVSSLELLGSEDDSSEVIPLATQVEKVRELAGSLGRQAIEASIGWDLSSFLSEGGPDLTQYPLDFLEDLADLLGVSWRQLMPHNQPLQTDEP